MDIGRGLGGGRLQHLLQHYFHDKGQLVEEILAVVLVVADLNIIFMIKDNLRRMVRGCPYIT